MNKKEIIRLYLTKKRPKSVQINDLVAFFIGEKDIIYAQIFDTEDEKLLRDLTETFGLFFTKIGNKISKINSNRASDVLIGRNISLIKKVEKLYLDSEFFEWALYLGYPQCCVKEYEKWRNNIKNTYKPIILSALINSESKTIPYYMNNITNFYSRLTNEKLRKMMKKYIPLNMKYIEKGIDLESFIIWHPCSYSCRKSIIKARKIAAGFKEYLPDLYRIRKKILSKPVLFKSDFEFVLLDGYAKHKYGNLTVNYSGIYPFPKTFLKTGDLKRILKHKTIKSKKGKITYPLELSDFVLLPFTE